MTLQRFSAYWPRAAVVAVVGTVLAFAFAFGSAEAGDEFGDTASDAGEVDGTLAGVLGGPDSAFVQIGTSQDGGSVTVEFDDRIVDFDFAHLYVLIDWLN